LFKFRKKAQEGLSASKKDGVEKRKISAVSLIKEIIAGDVFLRETVQKQFLYVLLLFVLSLFYVNNRFLYEKELREVNRMRNELVDLRYRSLTISKELKLAGRRTMILDALNECGSNLKEATEPVIIIED
jgi:hypothetical protein